MNFETSVDHDADIQMVVECGDVNVFVNMLMADARSVHEKLGRAITEEQEEIDHFGEEKR